MKNTKRIISILLIAALMVVSLTGCGKREKSFDAANDIHVTSREDGSGTRGAFVELFGIEKKDENGEKVDYTTPTAATTNSTSVMMTTVAGDLMQSAISLFSPSIIFIFPFIEHTSLCISLSILQPFS